MRKIAGASALRRFFVCENVVEPPVPFGEFVRKLQNMAEIAEKLFISPHTVRKHIAHIYDIAHIPFRNITIKMC